MVVLFHLESSSIQFFFFIQTRWGHKEGVMQKHQNCKICLWLLDLDLRRCQHCFQTHIGWLSLKTASVRWSFNFALAFLLRIAVKVHQWVYYFICAKKWPNIISIIAAYYLAGIELQSIKIIYLCQWIVAWDRNKIGQRLEPFFQVRCIYRWLVGYPWGLITVSWKCSFFGFLGS